MTLGRAWALALNQNLTGAAALADRCQFNECDAAAVRCGRLELDLLWSFIYLMRDDGTRALARAESARRWSSDADTTNRIDALRRCAFWLLGDLRSYNSAPKPIFTASRVQGEHILQTFIRGVETAVQAQQLRLGTAERLADACASGPQTRRLLKEPFLLPAVLAATLIYERGETSQAASRIRKLMPAIQAHGCIETAVHAYKTLARASSRLVHSEFALSVLREGESVAGNKGWPRLALVCMTERIRILADLERCAEAELHLERLGQHGQTSSYWLLASSRLELLRNPTETTSQLLQRLIEQALARGELKLAVELGIRRVALLLALGKTEEARAVLEPILLVSADAGLFQTVLDGGLTVRNLLLASTPDVSRASHVDAYAQILIDAWGELARPFSCTRPERRLSGPLTARECNILELIGGGNSNKHVARLLGITPETVKSHTKRIFRRLDACTRAEAVSKASSLGIL